MAEMKSDTGQLNKHEIGVAAKTGSKCKLNTWLDSSVG